MSAGEIEFKFLGSRAAAMLADALQAAHDRGVSQRTLAKRLNYKQSVVLSHMAKGRVPVPLDRAAQIAVAVGIDAAEFLLAAVEQRTKDAPKLLRPSDVQSSADSGFAGELALLAGGSLDLLDEQHRGVIREVVTDGSPRRRWLSAAELPVVLRLRERRPQMQSEGLAAGEMQLLVSALGREGS